MRLRSLVPFWLALEQPALESDVLHRMVESAGGHSASQRMEFGSVLHYQIKQITPLSCKRKRAIIAGERAAIFKRTSELLWYRESDRARCGRDRHRDCEKSSLQ